MKIIGFVYHAGKAEMVLKCDSCLLNGSKPFFLPDGESEIGVTDCMVLRVSRLGKHIAPAFAKRYYDAVAPGADFTDLQALNKAQAEGRPWTQALVFDFSLAVGEWTNGEWTKGEWTNGEWVKGEWTNGEWVMSPEEAIVEASKRMTIRQGDLIFIQKRQAPRVVQKEEIIHAEIDGEERLYCKIK